MAGTTFQASIATDRPLVERPYAPSWVDRLQERVEQIPGPTWVVYLGASLALYALITVIKWASGAYPVGTFFPFHFVGASGFVLSLAGVHYLDGVAARALASFRPALIADEKMYRTFHYRLTTMPARQTLLVTLAAIPMTLFVSLQALVLSPATARVMKMWGSPLEIAVDSIFTHLAWTGTAIFLYHAAHQLSYVHRILAEKSAINLFRLEPLYAFSNLTARTAAVMTLAVLAWALSLPDVLNMPGSILFVALYVIFGLVLFAMPLLGMREALIEEKARLKAESGLRLEMALAELHRRMDAGELPGMGELQAAIDSLVKEREVLDRVPVWPWEADTVRLLLSALLLPILLIVVQRVLDMVLRF